MLQEVLEELNAHGPIGYHQRQFITRPEGKEAEIKHGRKQCFIVKPRLLIEVERLQCAGKRDGFATQGELHRLPDEVGVAQLEDAFDFFEVLPEVGVKQ